MLIGRWAGLAGTATFRSVNGYEGWSTESQLIANLIDTLAAHDFHQLKIGGSKSARKPSPMERPWDRAKTFGSDAVPYDEIDSWMRSTWR